MFKYVKIAVLIGILVETTRNLRDEVQEIVTKKS